MGFLSVQQCLFVRKKLPELISYQFGRGCGGWNGVRVFAGEVWEQGGVFFLCNCFLACFDLLGFYLLDLSS